MGPALDYCRFLALPLPLPIALAYYLFLVCTFATLLTTSFDVTAGFFVSCFDTIFFSFFTFSF